MLPYLALTVSMVPWLLLTMRAAVVEATGSDAVRAARARGVNGWTLLRGHVVPVSVLPTLALLGTRLPELIAGAAIVAGIVGLAIGAAIGLALGFVLGKLMKRSAPGSSGLFSIGVVAACVLASSGRVAPAGR